MPTYSKEIYQNQWILTDDAFLQHGCPTSEEAITGTDLTQCKLPHRKLNLSERIFGAEQRREKHINQTQSQREGR